MEQPRLDAAELCTVTQNSPDYKGDPQSSAGSPNPTQLRLISRAQAMGFIPGGFGLGEPNTSSWTGGQRERLGEEGQSETL